MTCELENMWKEVVMTFFKVLSQHFLGGTEEKHKKTQSLQLGSELRSELGTFQTWSIRAKHWTMAFNWNYLKACFLWPKSWYTSLLMMMSTMRYNCSTATIPVYLWLGWTITSCCIQDILLCKFCPLFMKSIQPVEDYTCKYSTVFSHMYETNCMIFLVISKEYICYWMHTSCFWHLSLWH